jgi:hypothetical protein
MENTRDTFYVTLRNRLAALNPGRTMVLRGTVRPGVLVEENELATTFQPVDAFCLHWTDMRVDPVGALPLVTMECEIRYATDGSAGNGGMDRGRLLAAMDGELAAALGTQPRYAVKTNYAGVSAGVAPVAMATNVFWGDVAFAAVVTRGERVERVATVEIFSYQEAGEL